MDRCPGSHAEGSEVTEGRVTTEISADYDTAPKIGTTKHSKSQSFRNHIVEGSAPHPTAPTMSKMGRYMATIMPPTRTPRTTIMMGSMTERRAVTAVSTSSS